MSFHVEVLSCLVQIDNGNVVIPKQCSVANFTVAVVRTVAAAERSMTLATLAKQWAIPGIQLEDVVFCKENGAEIATTSTFDDYLEYTGQKPAAGSPPPKNTMFAVYLLVKNTPVSIDTVLKDKSTMVTFQVIGQPVASAASKEAPGPGAAQKKSTIGIEELRKRCSAEKDLQWENITMDLVKKAIIGLKLAKEFDIWDGLQSKLLDYNLSFESYCSRVWKHDASFNGKLVVLFGLKKDHDQQTVQQVYQSGDFLIKFTQMKDDKPSPVGSVRVKNEAGQSETDVLLWTALKDMTLVTFRGRIRTMSQLATKHEFCLLDGSPVPDTTTFASYVDLLDETSPFENSVPSISLRFKELESRWTGGDKAKEAVKNTSSKLKSEDVLGQLITPGTVDYIDRTKLNLNNATLEAFGKENIMGTKPLSVPSKLDEHEWSLIMQNCHVMNGWYVDEYTNQIKMAARPAFTLRKNLNILGVSPLKTSKRSPTTSPTKDTLSTKAKSTSKDETQQPSPEAGTNALTATADQSKSSDDKQAGFDKPNAIPTYRVNDGTKIDIVTVEDETRHSFVRNSFEKSSTEATVSGGYGGVGVGVSGGMSSESQKGHKDEQKVFTSKMIGQYMIPRVTLMLKPEDLEPTEEMAIELKKIQTGKEAMDVRHFYKRFGQFFAQEVTLGGMLVSTRVIEAKETTEEEKTKEAFKTAIGLSITTPINAGVEVKHEKTNGQDESDLQGKRGVNDRVVFEAIGGNTILAAVPQHWCPSVGDHLNWRVIERSDLQPMVETISSTPKFESASEWFAITIPSLLTEYIEIPRSMQLLAQFRFREKSASNRPEYLVHQVDKPISIIVNGNHVDPPLFQGPRISSYDRATWGARDGVWVITPKNMGLLRDGSRVTIRTSHDLSVRRYLAVIRTSANFFVPCISTSGHEPIWTIRKAPIAGKSLSALPSTEPLGDNDTFCLTFDFINNNRGYRDFVDDERGYRRRDYPEATNDRLLLAKPVDGTNIFDKSTLLMTDEAIEADTQSRRIKVKGNYHSVAIATFTMDLLASDGTDENDDILLMDGDTIKKNDEEMRDQLLQTSQTTVKTEQPKPNP